jgi:hypothetical protein
VLSHGFPFGVGAGLLFVCAGGGDHSADGSPVIDLFVGLWASTGRKDYLAFAQRVARQLVSRGSNLDGKGIRWYQAWTRVKPWEVSAETGYSIGAAGVGCALLHVHLAEQGKYRAILFPGNPFPEARRAGIAARGRPS